jgi:predicted FMN-binding regulatory protein PaiB
MYRPDLFRVDDVPQMHALMRARPFAALISNGAAGLYASHLSALTESSSSISREPIRIGKSLPKQTKR